METGSGLSSTMLIAGAVILALAAVAVAVKCIAGGRSAGHFPMGSTADGPAVVWIKLAVAMALVLLGVLLFFITRQGGGST